MPDRPLHIQTLTGRNALGAVVVQLRGAADLSSEPALERAFADLAADRPDAVILDLTGLTYLGSPAIGRIVALWDALRAHNGVLVITNPGPTVRQALDRVRLSMVIPVIAGLEAPWEALAVA